MILCQIQENNEACVRGTRNWLMTSTVDDVNCHHNDMIIPTWFGSISFDSRHVIISSEESSENSPDDVIALENDIEDVASTHLHVAILMKNGQLAWRRIDDFERKPSFLDLQTTSDDVPPTASFLVSTSREIYMIRRLQNSSELLKILEDSKGICEEKIDFPWPVKIVDARGGHDFLIYRDSAGNLFSMGTGTRGELGVGLIRRVDEPVHIELLAGIPITKVSCGGWHTVVLTESGDAYTWGWNRYGQLGKNKAATEVYPVLLDPFEEFEGVESEDIDDVTTTENTTTVTIGSAHFVLGGDTVEINEFELK